ncbi:ARS binding protein 2-domain-containing protein [Stachybotrys elegans]|uniref:ARS binding protein 2-domain-containing protein n=1 Tax=Stachybotrys elegans TaxID=80388 RepID=A0A8K0WSA3_9HYPO|nr:ARS binding protein 2-domain-containing protein [Stachybotrys elegans]
MAHHSAAHGDANGAATPSGGFLARPQLPDRDVTEATIEDAYVRFIFCCNPALPPKADTDSLREAFRNPPRSGGRVFSPFRIYELSKLFYEKEIKTWTELTVKLGVEPPDPTRDESAQKIAQYGVRLKKWMNSMRVKAFFEYLMNIPNDYWTRIPNDPNPIALPIRDGVAVEDDMALRALLPHIRPKRGRKRPEADDTASPAQRQRLSPTSAIDDPRQASAGPWSAHPDSAAPPGSLFRPNPALLGPGDVAQEPLTRWPQSAVTPTTRNSFWDDALEPRSAVTPSKQKMPHQRRGAKNVSSAWRPGGLDTGGKTRGRPPMNRTPLEEVPYLSNPSWHSSPRESDAGQSMSPKPPYLSGGMGPMESPNLHHVHPSSSLHTVPEAMPPQHRPATHDGPRPARPSISLQVPERPPGSVRLATPPLPPPPPPQPPSHTASGTNGHHYQQNHQNTSQAPDTLNHWTNTSTATVSEPSRSEQPFPAPGGGPGSLPEFHFETVEDRTNVDVVTTFFTRVMHEGDWIDAQGNPAEAPSLDECTAIVHAVIETMYTTAATPQSFLINLAALAGARMLMTTRAKCTRLGEETDSTCYRFEWEYRFGKFKAPFNMVQNVAHRMFKKPEEEDEELDQAGLTAKDWQKKYERLLDIVRNRDKELMSLRTSLMDSLRNSSLTR